MKKLLTVLAASVGIAAFADTTPPLSATSFEGYDGPFSVAKGDLGGEDDAAAGDRTWAGSDADGDTNAITEYGTGVDALPKPGNRPDYYAGDNQAQSAFLKIDSTEGIARYVKKGGFAQDLTANVYFDMDVQFTVSDSIQDPAPGDKLLVWLYAPDTEDAQTNLVITAATINSDTLVPTAVNYVAATPAVAADTWYRLTVVSTTKDFEGDKVPHFQVYIDGTQVVPSGTMDSTTGEISSLSGHDGLFGSLVQFDEDVSATKTLTSVTFKGTGAVDDLVVTTVKPECVNLPSETMYFQVGTTQYATFAQALANAGSSTITMLADYDVATEKGIVFSAGTVTLDMGTFDLTDSRTEGDYAAAITVSGGALTIVGSGSIGLSTIKGSDSILVTEGGTLALGAENASVPGLTGGLYVDGSYTVKVWGSAEPEFKPYDESETAFTWTAPATTPGYYVITTGGGDEPTSDTYDIPGDASLSDGAITVPTGTAKIKLGEYDVTTGFTINGTTATLKTPVIEANGVEGDANEDEPLVVTATEVKIGVKAVPGLYYGVGTNPDVTKVARPATLIKFTGNRAEIFTKAKTENVAGEFYKVYVDIKAE